MADSNIQKDLKSLEQYYQQKQYDKGVEWLLQNKDAYSKGQFHYNLGVFLTKEGNLAAGRYNFEKAIKEGYVNTQVYHNLTIVESQLNVNDISNSKSAFDQSINYALSISPDAYLLFSLILVLIVLTLKKLRLIKEWAIAGVFIALALIPFGASKLYLDRLDYAINLKEVKIFEGPSKMFPERGSIKPGTKVIIGQKDGEWLFIKSPLLLAGWVNKNDMALY